MAGYCDNGYRLWNPNKRNIEFARNVIFDESKETDVTMIDQSVNTDLVPVPVVDNVNKSECTDELGIEEMESNNETSVSDNDDFYEPCLRKLRTFFKRPQGSERCQNIWKTS